MKGKFITFEGAEGSGKSTQAQLVYRYLKSRNRKVLFIREPGGNTISEAIRRVLLNVKNTKMTDECETLLYMAARSQIVEEVILPALQKGTIVLCDRFLDSTVVYQGYGNGVDVKFIQSLGRFVTHGIKPDVTFLFDIDVKKGLSRTGKSKDRIELRSLSYHNRVRKGYLQLAKKESGRIKLIKVNQNKEAIYKIVQKQLDKII